VRPCGRWPDVPRMLREEDVFFEVLIFFLRRRRRRRRRGKKSMEERRPHRLFALAGALLHDSDSAIVAQTQKTLLHAEQRRETKYLFFNSHLTCPKSATRRRFRCRSDCFRR